MAFKQKAGSPFQRNFGIGKSPAKQTSPMKDTGEEWLSKIDRAKEEAPTADDIEYAKKHDALHSKNDPMDPAHGEPAPTQMKSPMHQEKPDPDRAAHINKAIKDIKQEEGETAEELKIRRREAAERAGKSYDYQVAEQKIAQKGREGMTDEEKLIAMGYDPKTLIHKSSKGGE